MNSLTRISKQHGAMQLFPESLTFWFKGQWYTLNNQNIKHFMKMLKGNDKVWFRNALYS